jgi:hypothetical protein
MAAHQAVANSSYWTFFHLLSQPFSSTFRSILSYTHYYLRGMDTDISPNPEAIFRPVKRRKFLRRREFEPEDSQEAHVANANSVHDNDSSAAQPPSQLNETVSSRELARLRRLQRARKGGIEFSNTSRQSTDKTGNQAVVTTEDLENERIRAMCDRFTAYTGRTVDVDKHMYGSPYHLQCAACDRD